MKLTSPFFSRGASARTATRTPTALGSAIFDRRTSLSWPLPGSAHLGLRNEPCVASAIVCENVLLWPAGEIEQSTRRKEIETGPRQLGPLLAREPLVELLLQPMKIAHVARGIVPLGIA